MRCLQALLLAAAAAGCAAADTLWCRTDSDCAAHYQNASRCTAGACVCAGNGSYPIPGVPLCARDGRSVFFIYVRVMFSRPDTCPDDVAVKPPLVNAVLGAVGASTLLFWAESECADTYYMTDVYLNVPDLALHTHNLTDLVGRRLQQDGNATLQQAGLLQPTHVGVRWLDSLRCDVPHATEAEYRHPHCLATACEAGHVLNATHGTCELQTTDPITTGEPDTDAPPAPTLHPDEAGPTDTVWCRQDSDCRAYTDSSAVCTRWGKCACSPRYGHLVNADTGRTAYTCVPPIHLISTEKVVAVWSVQACTRGVLLEVTQALASVTRGLTTDTADMTCSQGEAVFVAEVDGASMRDLLTTDLVAALEAELMRDTYSEGVRGLGRPTAVLAERVYRIQCKVPHAAGTQYVDRACVVRECAAGYVVSGDARSCEAGIVTTAPHSSDDDSLSGGAIAGIVCGAVVGVALLAAGVWLLCLRKDAPAAPQENTGDVDLQGREPHTAEV